MPAALVFIATVFVLQMAGYLQHDGHRWFHVLTYTVNFDSHPYWHTGHLWSLSIEEQFYLFWPLALRLLGPKKAGWAVVGYLALAPVLRVGVYFLLRDQ